MLHLVANPQYKMMFSRVITINYFCTIIDEILNLLIMNKTLCIPEDKRCTIPWKDIAINVAICFVTFF